MAQAEAATVRKQVVVDAPIERAFSVFTGRFGDFKPPEHNLLGAPIAETVIVEPIAAPRVKMPMIESPPTVSPQRVTLISASKRSTH